MRILDLGNDLTLGDDGRIVIGDRQHLCARLFAYLAWPSSEDDRDAFLAVKGAERIEKLAPTDRRRIQLIKGVFETHGGGFGPVVRAAYDGPLGARLNAGLLAAERAGYQLLFTAILASHHADNLRGGASLGKARDLLAQLSSERGQARSNKTMLDAWSTHHAIAHLSAAILFVQKGELVAAALGKPFLKTEQTPLDVVLSQTEEVIQLAVDFLEFASTFRPLRRNDSILKLDEAWRLPIDIAARSIARVVPQVSDDCLDFLTVERWAGQPLPTGLQVVSPSTSVPPLVPLST